MTDLRLSKKGVNQYWNNTGAYQKEYEESDWEYTPDEMYHSFISLLRENFGECEIISEKINNLRKLWMLLHIIQMRIPIIVRIMKTYMTR